MLVLNYFCDTNEYLSENGRIKYCIFISVKMQARFSILDSVLA